jgi:Ca2+-binding RTX toxin-like protein
MVARIDGTVRNDFLNGSITDEDIYGRAGDDSITGGGGHDQLYGGDGDDFLASGNTTAADGSAAPFVDTVGDLLDGGAGDDILDGAGGADTLLGGTGDDILLGEDGNDTLDGGDGLNVMLGGAGDDHYEIHSRNDLVYDSAGHDSGTIYLDWYKTDPSVDDWTWAKGVQKVPYWIDALVYAGMPAVAAGFGTAKTIYYSFAQTPPEFFNATDKDGFKAFNSAQIAYTKQVLAYIESVIDVHFVETADAEGQDTIVFANNSQKDSAGYGVPLDLLRSSARVMVDASALALNPERDNGAEFLRVVTHEIGHALGLKHPFADPDATGGASIGPFLPASDDDLVYTEMSYTGDEHHPGTFSPLDIAALQYIYGAAPTDHGTDTRWIMGTSFALIGDGGGIDVIDGMAQTQNLTIFLDDGYWSYIGAKADSITARGQFSINIGTTIEDAIGGSGNDHISGNEVDNDIAGGAGNDVLRGEAGNDKLAGGAGLDTAAYAGAHDGFVLAQGNGTMTVTDKSGAEGVDTLSGVERVVFSDGALAFDLTGSAGQAYRLYAAAFDRKPDVAGLTYWIGVMDAGQPLLQVATNFTKSDEFTAMYGATRTPEVFLTKLYEHILHRAPDAAGYAFWLDSMHKGVSEGQVLADFGESAENVAQVIAQIQNGIWYTPGTMV